MYFSWIFLFRSYVAQICSVTQKNGLNSFPKKLLCPNYKKTILKIRLSIRIRNFTAPNQILNFLFYFNLKVALP